jgi:hypothetical protein
MSVENLWKSIAIAEGFALPAWGKIYKNENREASERETKNRCIYFDLDQSNHSKNRSKTIREIVSLNGLCIHYKKHFIFLGDGPDRMLPSQNRHLHQIYRKEIGNKMADLFFFNVNMYIRVKGNVECSLKAQILLSINIYHQDLHLTGLT